MVDERTKQLVAATAHALDPQGENDDISLMTGMVIYGIENDLSDWDGEAIKAAIRWNWKDAPDFAEEQIQRFENSIYE